MGRYFTPPEEKDPIVGKDGGTEKSDAVTRGLGDTGNCEKGHGGTA